MFAIAVFGAIVAGDHGPTSIDRWALSLVDHLPGGIWRTASKISSPVVLGIAVTLCAAFALRRSWRLAVTCLMSPAIALILVTVAKDAFERRYEGALSYPSGNVAAVAAVVSVALLVLPRRHRAIFVSLGALVICANGIAVVYLRWHYATDAIAGAMLGAAVVAIINDLMVSIAPAGIRRGETAVSPAPIVSESSPTPAPSPRLSGPARSPIPLWATDPHETPYQPGPHAHVEIEPTARDWVLAVEPPEAHEPVPVADLIEASQPEVVLDEPEVPEPVFAVDEPEVAEPVLVVNEPDAPEPVFAVDEPEVHGTPVVATQAPVEASDTSAEMDALVEDLDEQLNLLRLHIEQMSPTGSVEPSGDEDESTPEAFVVRGWDFIEEAVARARREATEVIAAARAEADALVEHARTKAQGTLDVGSPEFVMEAALKELENSIDSFSRANGEVTRDLYRLPSHTGHEVLTSSTAIRSRSAGGPDPQS